MDTMQIKIIPVAEIWFFVVGFFFCGGFGPSPLLLTQAYSKHRGQVTVANPRHQLGSAVLKVGF